MNEKDETIGQQRLNELIAYMDTHRGITKGELIDTFTIQWAVTTRAFDKIFNDAKRTIVERSATAVRLYKEDNIDLSGMSYEKAHNIFHSPHLDRNEAKSILSSIARGEQVDIPNEVTIDGQGQRVILSYRIDTPSPKDRTTAVKIFGELEGWFIEDKTKELTEYGENAEFVEVIEELHNKIGNRFTKQIEGSNSINLISESINIVDNGN